MTAEEQAITRLRDLFGPEFRHVPQDVWELQAAARGLTVIMTDGTVWPLRCSRGAAVQLLHLWSVQALQ